MTVQHDQATNDQKNELMLRTLKKCISILSARLFYMEAGVLQPGSASHVEEMMALVSMMQWAVEYAEDRLFEEKSDQ